MRDKKILVTGGAGFIGSHLVERLSAANEVTVFDDLSTGSLRNLQGAKEEVRLHRASILQPKQLAKALEGQELVFHLAAKTSVPESVAKPDEYWRTNVEGTLNVLKTAADAGVKRVVFISSAANEVTVFDDLSTGSLRNLQGAKEEVRLHRASILQPKQLTKALEGQELVFHLAAKTSVPESVAKPDEYWRTNVEGTLNVLKTAADAGVKRVVFISSAAIYGSSETVPKVETMRPEPASPYATTKMVGEFACQEISQLKPVETVALRLFNAYGPRQDPDAPYAGVIAKFSAAVAHGKPIEIYGDGDQTRDFLYAADAAEAMELAGERPVAGQIFNLGTGAAVTVNEVARLLSEIAAGPVKAVRKEIRPGDVRHSRADIGRAMEKLGFAPKTSLREGIERTLRWHQEAPKTD